MPSTNRIVSAFLLFGAAFAACTLQTADGYTWVYDYYPARNSSKPTLLLLHGVPDTRDGWRYQIPVLLDAGYGVLAPDLLGFGESSAPADLEAYNLKVITSDIIELLDAENVQTAIGVAHDLGVAVLSRLAAYYPDRFTRLAFLSVGYDAPGTFLDVDAINAADWPVLGYTRFGYWYFFNSYDAADIASQHLESFFHLCFATNESSWGTDFANIGAARTWLTSNRTTELPQWLSESDKAAWLQSFSDPRTIAGALNHYKARLRGVQAADEANVTDEEKTLKVPVLTVGGKNDLVSLADSVVANTEPWTTAGYVQKVVDAGHWVTLETADEIGDILLAFADPDAVFQ
ncbi:alpha/beta-hydrolase [Xylariaceae sp. FL1272]|nr:alpha/beta-hydrolase [Xylariaceae sp. FL1272]